MADGEMRRRDREPTVQRLAVTTWVGLSAEIMRTDPGRHAVVRTEDRVVFHAGAPIRANCECDGIRREGWQSRGDFDLVPRDHAGTWEDESSAELIVIRLTPALMETTAQSLGLPQSRSRIEPWMRARDPHVEHIAWALKAELEAVVPAPKIYGESLGVALAARLLQRYSQPRRAQPHGLTPRQLRQVVDHVEAHIDGDLTLAELAASAGVSVSHFTAMFRRAMGQSAHRYVVERRVLRAQDLLARRRVSIAEVAEATGFAHPSHLARWMRRVIGVAPSDLARAR